MPLAQTFVLPLSMDRLSRERRSWLMSRVRGKDTVPEYAVRRLLHRLGYRYRLHVAALPGKPDLVFPARKKVVFVHGCFWHGHECRLGRRPRSNVDFWVAKAQANRTRDALDVERLHGLGWQVFIVWQCQTRDADRLTAALVQFLGAANKADRHSKIDRV